MSNDVKENNVADLSNDESANEVSDVVGSPSLYDPKTTFFESGVIYYKSPYHSLNHKKSTLNVVPHR